ncbi:MAG TPA: ATP-binding protein, partial [Armatimonadota bacterium]|nr:ATP-binding protein [Armatimonadota bacterium]
VAFAAHELRNPISAIKTGVALLQDETLDVATRRQVVNSIDRSAAALMRLVLNFLNLGRVEAGELRLQRRAVALAELGDTLLEELRQYHTGIETRVACDLPAIPVDIDLEYIKLVLANLIDNAVKFSPAHAPIEISGEALNGMAVVHVRDHGSGIPRDRLPLIFSRYETAGGEARGGQRGFGLGLYMARLLVESHGGAIWAESEEGQGTTISFSLPRAG